MTTRKSPSKTKPARPTTVAAYLASLTPERRAVIEKARTLVRKHIPKGYAEFMNWGVINWGIPLDKFSMGNCCLHFKTLDDLELTSVAKVIAMSTPKEYVAYYERARGLA